MGKGELGSYGKMSEKKPWEIWSSFYITSIP